MMFKNMQRKENQLRKSSLVATESLIPNAFIFTKKKKEKEKLTIRCCCCRITLECT